MTATGSIQCPHCGTQMDVSARFCPGCGTPRTALRQQLEREAAATGVPYAQLLDRERAGTRTGMTGGPTSGATGWNVPATAPPAPPKERGRLWLVLAIIGGVLLLFCAGCAVVSVILINRFDIDLGDSSEGDAARGQLKLATAGRHDERWERLHPGQQAVVSADLFATCAEYDDADSIDIIASFGDGDAFVSRVGFVDTRVVIYTISDGGSTETGFVEMVEVNGDWRWTMTGEDIDSYEAGRCP